MHQRGGPWIDGVDVPTSLFDSTEAPLMRWSVGTLRQVDCPGVFPARQAVASFLRVLVGHGVFFGLLVGASASRPFASLMS